MKTQVKKKSTITYIVPTIIILITSLSFNTGKTAFPTSNVQQDTIIKFRDGTFTGMSQSSYTDEPYWGMVKIKIENGLLTDVSFRVRDSILHETFDGAYEKHFAGNQVYIEQARNDWKGVQDYPKKLLESKDIHKVDAVSGATWSYNIFRASLEEALKSAVAH
jgi:major membrane immunogen (membrane-anchored lipoprotein)